MAIPIFKSAISVLCALLLLSPALGISDVPFIVAHKKASLNRLKSGVERVSVSIDIYNQGSAPLAPILFSSAVDLIALVHATHVNVLICCMFDCT
ncbi:hypothetical protein CRG98_014099 [Punica granatum]|uniref:Translocon-associated protein subunit beta-like n=1 Tax=Punica granatum TaxID=22663 RepID=A0A2I0KAF3_PUNGR|nr:hypothetical protein CRG98_014099 [Punica granatum]